jgi:hypothetical protein
MLPFLSKKSAIKLKVLAWYQIIGGITGLLLTIWLIAHTGQINGLILLILLFATGLYSFSFYCGRLLMTNKYLIGFKLSLINQAIQILQFAMLGYAFWYASGLMFTLGIKVNNGFTFTFDFGFFSTYQISLAIDETEFKLAINLVAIYVIYFTRNLRTTIAQEKIDFDSLEISTESEEERLAYEE